MAPVAHVQQAHHAGLYNPHVRSVVFGLVLALAAVGFVVWTIIPVRDVPSHDTVTPAIIAMAGEDIVADGNNVRTDERTGRRAVHDPDAFRVQVYEADGTIVGKPLKGCLGWWYPDGRLSFRDECGKMYTLNPDTGSTCRVAGPNGAPFLKGGALMFTGNWGDQIRKGQVFQVQGRPLVVRSIEVKITSPGNAVTILTIESQTASPPARRGRFSFAYR